MASNNFGKFEGLPFELRSQIWEHLRPQNDTIKSDLRILRTSRSLLSEILPHLYDKDILTFKLSPLYRRNSWITVSNQLGATWLLESLSHARSLGFADIPCQKLKGIEIQIPAPDPTDPGQLINIWMKVRELRQLFLGKEMPEVSINLLDTANTSWMTPDGEPQQSIPSGRPCPHCDDIEDFDYEIVLMELCVLRSCRTTQIHVPETMKTSTQVDLDWFDFVIGLDQPFGTFLGGVDDGSPGPWDDESTKVVLDGTFLDLETALDELPGQTACMMRLERFSSWHEHGESGPRSKYLDELERILLTGRHSLHHIAHIKWRYRLIVAFNPLSTKMQKRRFQDKLFQDSLTSDQLFAEFPETPSRYIWGRKQWKYYYWASVVDFEGHKKQDMENRARERELRSKILQSKKEIRGISTSQKEEISFKDRWENEEWYKYYPEGIPPLGQDLFMFEIEMGHLWSDSSIEPRKRFRDWDNSYIYWELPLMQRMMHKAVASPTKPPSSACSYCGLGRWGRCEEWET